ncbi:MAG: L-seryl-tRNA(Sec) selenium transferase [Desulfovibrionaceae bacterium]|nr:L-seryl-tRNA(Sec) selenium transferase [Desulfovibrionaceae bacterium]
MTTQDLYRLLPSVDAIKQKLFACDPAIASLSNERLRSIISAHLDSIRLAIRSGRCTEKDLVDEKIMRPLVRACRKLLSPRLCSVLNGTGVVVHTNMGRSVLCREAQEAVLRAAQGYTNLELNLETGQRGSRYDIVEDELCMATGAEGALVVNNNAAAVLLMLDTFCRDGSVVVSRGELVEIGGSFRIPDVMARSGAKLKEVGTTNRTHLSDYASAIGPDTKALLRVHTSNFRIVGFHSRVSLEELAGLARENQLLLLEDLGSGSLVHCGQSGLPDEPTVQETLAAGADIVTFSGDKVLGGPQAGILVGRKTLIEAMKRNQLTRALRCDKLCLAALEATLRLYRNPDEALLRIPTLAGITRSKEALAEEARALASAITLAKLPCAVTCEPGASRVGGGAFPQYDLPTTLVCLKPYVCSVVTLKNALLATDPPLIGRLENDCFCMDPRTLAACDYPRVVAVLSSALRKRSQLKPSKNGENV